MVKAIEVENLWYIYPNGVVALKNINLEINVGEKVAIIGPNGAGKSTLIKHFNGLLKPFKGTVKVFGTDTRKATVATLARRVGVIFQNPYHQFFSESVWDEVAFALKNFGFSEEAIRYRVTKVLRLFDLYDYADRSPFTLSSGEMRRLAIATVLAYDPDVIVFDEPTVGQDRFQKEKIREYIKLLSLQGKTIILVTHDIDFVAEGFDKIVVMNKGEILAIGKPKDILYDEELLTKANLIMPQIPRLVKEAEAYNILKHKPLTEDDLARKIVEILRCSM